MKFPLRFGMAAHAAQYGGQPFPAITDYQIDIDRRYPVKVGEKTEDEPWGTSREVGQAKAGRDGNDFWVEYQAGDPNPRFYSVWKVDRSGIARLDAVLMATGPYGGVR